VGFVHATDTFREFTDETDTFVGGSAGPGTT
jgi:hypothetical protein